MNIAVDINTYPLTTESAINAINNNTAVDKIIGTCLNLSFRLNNHCCNFSILYPIM